MTQNVKRLICERAAQLQIEAAKKQYGGAGFGEVFASIMASDGAILQASLRQASEWVKAALGIARRAPGAEQWPTDEDMAGEILRQIGARRKGSALQPTRPENA